MLQIPSRAKKCFMNHGWTESDVQYLADHGERIHEDDGWAMGMATAPDGVVWLYPAAQNNVFPLSLWKLIRQYILDNEHVVIPMNKNHDKVMNAAKRYNGHLQDNLFLFGDKLKGIRLYEGGKRWSHSTT